MTEHKKGLRWFIFKWFGPPEVKNLTNYIDNLKEDGGSVVIYRAGKFELHLQAENFDTPEEPLVFATEEEQRSFCIGFNMGVDIFGFKAHALDEDQYEQIKEMRKKSTHGGGTA